MSKRSKIPLILGFKPKAYLYTIKNSRDKELYLDKKHGFKQKFFVPKAYTQLAHQENFLRNKKCKKNQNTVIIRDKNQIKAGQNYSFVERE